MPKSPDAFRTISEVADWLDIQAHVLRFWESKFTQVKPIKRAGGRRYYRPNDMLLLGGIKKLLHDDGLTIKGVQKILREEGMNHVAAMSVPLDDLTASQLDATPVKSEPAPAPMIEDVEPETGVVLPFGASTDQDNKVKDAPEDAELVDKTASDPVNAEAKTDEAEPAEAHEAAPDPEEPKASPTQADEAEPAAEPVPEPAAAAADEPLPDAPASEADAAEVAASQAPSDQADAEAFDDAEDMPTPDMFEATADAAEEAPEGALAEAEMEPMPSFLRHPVEPEAPTESAEETAAIAPDAAKDNMPAEPEEVAPPPAPKPRDIGMPEITPEAEIHAKPGALAAAFRRKPLSRAQVDQIRPLLEQLTALRDSMTAQRPPATKD